MWERWSEFKKTVEDFDSGFIQRRNLEYRQKAIFLDRDGTLNELNGFIKNPDEFTLLPQPINPANTILFICRFSLDDLFHGRQYIVGHNITFSAVFLIFPRHSGFHQHGGNPGISSHFQIHGHIPDHVAMI